MTLPGLGGAAKGVWRDSGSPEVKQVETTVACSPVPLPEEANAGCDASRGESSTVQGPASCPGSCGHTVAPLQPGTEVCVVLGSKWRGEHLLLIQALYQAARLPHPPLPPHGPLACSHSLAAACQ